MPNIQEWLRLYSSANQQVRIRAANALLDRAEEIPLKALIEILETLSWHGLGAKAQEALMKRRDADLVPVLIALLGSKDEFVREVACNVLGKFGDKTATPHLLGMVDDSCIMVRVAAGFGLAFLKDQSALPALKLQYERHRQDDSNVVMALQCALESLGESIGGRGS